MGMGGEYIAMEDELISTIQRLSRESGLDYDEVLDRLAAQHFKRISTPDSEEQKSPGHSVAQNAPHP